MPARLGEHIRDEELVINVCRTKHLTGHRAVPKAIVEALSPPRILSLDDAIEYVGKDELLEVTPQALRVRKKVLNHEVRQKTAKRARAEERGA
jgi:GTP-binding protein